MTDMLTLRRADETFVGPASAVAARLLGPDAHPDLLADVLAHLTQNRETWNDTQPTHRVEYLGAEPKHGPGTGMRTWHRVLSWEMCEQDAILEAQRAARVYRFRADTQYWRVVEVATGEEVMTAGRPLVILAVNNAHAPKGSA